jgi:hypothetical protein
MNSYIQILTPYLILLIFKKDMIENKKDNH